MKIAIDATDAELRSKGRALVDAVRKAVGDLCPEVLDALPGLREVGLEVEPSLVVVAAEVEPGEVIVPPSITGNVVSGEDAILGKGMMELAPEIAGINSPMGHRNISTGATGEAASDGSVRVLPTPPGFGPADLLASHVKMIEERQGTETIVPREVFMFIEEFLPVHPIEPNPVHAQLMEGAAPDPSIRAAADARAEARTENAALLGESRREAGEAHVDKRTATEPR